MVQQSIFNGATVDHHNMPWGPYCNEQPPHHHGIKTHQCRPSTPDTGDTGGAAGIDSTARQHTPTSQTNDTAMNTPLNMNEIQGHSTAQHQWQRKLRTMHHLQVELSALTAWSANEPCCQDAVQLPQLNNGLHMTQLCQCQAQNIT